VAPDVPVYSSTWIYIPGLEGHVSMWGIGPHGSFPLEKVEERKKAGDRFEFTTDGHICIDTPMNGIERILPWLSFKYDIEGYEFWGVDWYTYNPWNYGWHSDISQTMDGKNYNRTRYPNGDGYMVYPGKEIGQVEPAPSVRLLAARAGLDDFEIFKALAAEEAKGDAKAKQALDDVRKLVAVPALTRNSTQYLSDPEGLEKARIAAGEALEAFQRSKR